jgi:hypothetical protein
MGCGMHREAAEKRHGKKRISSIWNPAANRTGELTIAEGVTRELGDRADNGLGPYTSLIKAAFMGGFTG